MVEVEMGHQDCIGFAGSEEVLRLNLSAQVSDPWSENRVCQQADAVKVNDSAGVPDEGQKVTSVRGYWQRESPGNMVSLR